MSNDIFELGWTDEEIYHFLVDENGWDPSFVVLCIRAHNGEPLGDVSCYKPTEQDDLSE